MLSVRPAIDGVMSHRWKAIFIGVKLICIPLPEERADQADAELERLQTQLRERGIEQEAE